MKAARRLTTVILIAAPALLAAVSGCVFDVFRLPETALPTEEASLDQAGVSSLAYSADGSQLASAYFPGKGASMVYRRLHKSGFGKVRPRVARRRDCGQLSPPPLSIGIGRLLASAPMGNNCLPRRKRAYCAGTSPNNG